MNDKYREKFEQWLMDELEGGAFFGSLSLAVDSANEYLETEVYGAWISWQAALRYRDEQEKQA